MRQVANQDEEFFWEGVAHGKLLLAECAKCSRLQHPPSPMCPNCGSLQWDRREASGRGTVHSWIVSQHPNAADDPDSTGRIVALIDLEEGVRLVSNLAGVVVDEVRNDMPVVVTFVEVGGAVLPQFVPASIS